LSETFAVQNGLKQGNALWPLLFSFDLVYVIRKVQGSQVGLKLNWPHQFLVYAGDVYLLGDNISTIKKNTDAVIDTAKEVGPEVNTKKIRYRLVSHQNAGQNHNIKLPNRSFEIVARFKYLKTSVKSQNLIHEEIKRRLNLGSACDHSVQSLLSSCLMSKNRKIKIYRSIILPTVLHVGET
jgi:hypothetical protein